MDMDISMDIHGKSVDIDMDVKFHIHGKPEKEWGFLSLKKTRTTYKAS